MPAEISRFEKLTTIEADNNELSSLPSALACMAVYRLSLRRNSLSSSARVEEFLAPPSIAPPGSLPLSISIRELDLSSNGLAEVPPSIFACRGLEVGVWCVAFCAIACVVLCRTLPNPSFHLCFFSFSSFSLGFFILVFKTNGGGREEGGF